MTALAIEHEQPMHLIVVSRDLLSFAHLHPGASGCRPVDGAVQLPGGGDYVLYDEFALPGRGDEVHRFESPVGTEGTAAARLFPAPAPSPAAFTSRRSNRWMNFALGR